MMAILALIAIIAALVVLYLLAPRYRPLTLSAARFFTDEPQGVDRRFSLRRFVGSRPFYVQIGALLLLLTALIVAGQRLQRGDAAALGVVVAVDTSASMTGGDHWANAGAELDALAGHLAGLDVRACFAAWAFDLEARPLLAGDTPTGLSGALAGSGPRPLGTDLNLPADLLRAAQADNDAATGNCRYTHLVVISDQPAPEWTDDISGDLGVIWRDVGPPLDNVGIVTARRAGGGLFGWDGTVEVVVAAYGTPPPATALTVTAANGDPIAQLDLSWSASDRQTVAFVAPTSGLYTLSLDAGGAYPFDDRLTIAVDRSAALRVDWQHPDTGWLAALGWQQDNAAPQLRVLNAPGLPDDDTPTLLIGPGYTPDSDPVEILNFADDHPLLADLSLDIAETMGLVGPVLAADAAADLRPVLLATDGSAWIAARRDPPAAYVPGLPLASGDANADAFSTTVFFNALRWLLAESDPPALYTLTSISQPDPDGTRAALHPGEGQTALPDASRGAISDLQAADTAATADPAWLLPLLLALVLLTVERGLLLFGGRRWR